jgi:hypothetical protein
MSESAIPAYITSLIRRHTWRLDKSKGQGSPFQEGSATAGSDRTPGSHRNKHQLAARYRATHRDGTTTHSGSRVERIPDGLDLAGPFVVELSCPAVLYRQCQRGSHGGGRGNADSDFQLRRRQKRTESRLSERQFEFKSFTIIVARDRTGSRQITAD